jgi:hypothetical protein
LHETGRGVSNDQAAALTLCRQALAAGCAESAPAIERIEARIRQSASAA